MSISFMTLLVFSSIIFLVLYTLKSDYSSGPPYSHLYLVKKSHQQCNITGCIDNVNYKIKMEEKDGIIVFAYLVVLIGIIFPNLNQMD